MSLRLAAVAVLGPPPWPRHTRSGSTIRPRAFPGPRTGSRTSRLRRRERMENRILSGVWTTNGSPPGEIEKLFPGIADLAVPGDDPRGFIKFFLNVFADYKNEDVPIKAEALEVFLARAKSSGQGQPHLALSARRNPDGRSAARAATIHPSTEPAGRSLRRRQPATHDHLTGAHTSSSSLPGLATKWASGKATRWSSIRAVSTMDVAGCVRSPSHGGHADRRAHHPPRLRSHRRADDVRGSGAYTKPFSIKFTQTLTPDTDVIEGVCNENEKDREHLVGQ